MKKTLTLSAIMLGFIMASCSSNSTEQPIPFTVGGEARIVKDEIIFKGMSSYAKFLNSNVSGEIAYHSSREHPMQARDFSANSSKAGAYSQSSVGNTGLPVLINGKSVDELNGLDSKASYLKSSGNVVPNELYGKNVIFSFPKGSMVRSSASSSSGEISMYVPEVVEILYPGSHESLHPICYFDRYKIKWNEDGNNQNGVVISVEWDGDVLAAENANQNIRRIDIVEDTGETVIRKEMFDGIPHLAIVRVTIIRGNIDIAEINDMPYKIYAESNATLYTIIAKEPV